MHCTLTDLNHNLSLVMIKTYKSRQCWHGCLAFSYTSKAVSNWFAFLLDMPKLKLCFFTNSETEFLTKVLEFRQGRHKKESQIQLGLEIRKSPYQTAFRWQSGQEMDLVKYFPITQILTFTLKAFPVLLNLMGLSSFEFRTLNHYFLLVYLAHKEQKHRCKKACVLP